MANRMVYTTSKRECRAIESTLPTVASEERRLGGFLQRAHLVVVAAEAGDLRSPAAVGTFGSRLVSIRRRRRRR